MTAGHIVRAGEGQVADLGAIKMRLLVASEDSNGGFSVGDFTGGSGPWTVLHTHNHTEESFFVLDGSFTFAVGDDLVEVSQGDYLLVPRGTPHMMTGGPNGGRLLTTWTPSGNEEMFLELANLPPDSITDPQVRAAISAKYDSVPVR